ncbi:glycosyltransferase [Roseomonas sp. OT10]|uniref:glycosyltransferase n=1 Tax=Roseomonas cutis TaxID=2897332 RepID=UPI001E65880E|nr:glycosyltransferase [Roseomonas sp. OT10]UFN49365.1 glycosyltransferase [Roseomonas sp. OT10]
MPDPHAAINASGLFDVEYYRAVYPDIDANQLDPLEHYLSHGHLEGRRPNPSFDPLAYLAANPDVAAAGFEPLTHYVLCGMAEDRRLAPPQNGRSATTNAVMREVVQGRAFFRRFGLSGRRGVPPGEGAGAAVDDLIARSPAIPLDRLEPEVSIIIPVHGRLPSVLNCLDSLAGHRSRHPAEIIVVDGTPPAEMRTESLGTIPWIRYLRQDRHGGFGEACNGGAAVARGRILVFLHSDTRVADGWLDELIGSFRLFRRAGLVGSKLLNEGLTLQEAGGILWRNGDAQPYGQGQDPDNPKYSFARRADYCSGAAIAVPAEAWRRVGGFDGTFAPARREDADLAFRLQEAGYEVWMQPLAAVLHYGGQPHGRDAPADGEARQAAEMERFAGRWKPVLATHGPSGGNPDTEAGRYAQERLLALDAITPTPDRDAGSVVMVGMLRVLQSLGYQVAFVPQHNYLPDPDYTAALQREGIECIHSPFARNIDEALAFHGAFDIVFAFRFNVLEQVYGTLRRELPQARILFNNVDLHYLRQEREARLRRRRSGRAAAMMTKIAELELIAQVDCTIVHTPVETAIIKQEVAVDNIVEIPWITELSPTRSGRADRHDIMFLGGFAHVPNVDAVEYLVGEIWPLLLPQLPPEARLVIVGAGAPPSIQAMAGERIVVVGYADELEPYFDATRVFVAPLRYGAGIKGKVIETLRRGTPSVITSIAAEGMGLTSGRETLIADEAGDFARQVARLYKDAALWDALQQEGYDFVTRNFSWERCVELINQALDVADETWIARHERALKRRLAALCDPEG